MDEIRYNPTFSFSFNIPFHSEMSLQKSNGSQTVFYIDFKVTLKLNGAA